MHMQIHLTHSRHHSLLGCNGQAVDFAYIQVEHPKCFSVSVLQCKEKEKVTLGGRISVVRTDWLLYLSGSD